MSLFVSDSCELQKVTMELELNITCKRKMSYTLKFDNLRAMNC